MATVVDRLSVKLDGDIGGLRKSMRQANKSMQDVAKRAKSVGTSMSKFVTAPIVAAGAAAAKLAGDAEATGRKLDTVFGDSSDTIRDWADVTASQFGVAQQELESFAATMGDTLVPMGASRDQAEQMSKVLGEVGADLAAFNDEAPEQAFANLRRALTGSAESVMQYGIDVRQAAVEQELLEQGIEGGTEAATRAEEAQARLNIILRESADAQGAAANDADTLNGAIRRARAGMRDLGVTIGQRLLPIANAIASRIVSLVGLFDRLSEGMQTTILAFAGVAAIIGPVLVGFGTLASSILPALFAGATAAASAFATMWAAVTGPVGLAIAGITALAGTATLVVRNWEAVSGFFRRLFDGVMSLGGAFVTSLVALFETARRSIEVAIFGALESIVGRVREVLRRIGADDLADMLTPVAEGTEAAARRSGQALTEARGQIGTFDRAAADAAGTISDEVGGAWDSVSGAVGNATDSVREFFAVGEAEAVDFERSMFEGDFSGGGAGAGETDGGTRSVGLQGISDVMRDMPTQMPAMRELGTQIPQATEALEGQREAWRQAQEQARRFRIAAHEATELARSGVMRASDAIGQNLTDALFEGASAFQAMADAAVAALQEVISQLITATARALLLQALIPGGAGAAGGLTGAIGGLFGFAKGGIVTGPTPALIGEGTEAEAVLPLSRLEGMLNMSGGSQQVVIEPRVLPSGDITFAQREGDRRRSRVGRG